MHIRTDFQELLELSRQFVTLPEHIRLLEASGREIHFEVTINKLLGGKKVTLIYQGYAHGVMTFDINAGLGAELILKILDGVISELLPSGVIIDGTELKVEVNELLKHAGQPLVVKTLQQEGDLLDIDVEISTQNPVIA